VAMSLEAQLTFPWVALGSVRSLKLRPLLQTAVRRVVISKAMSSILPIALSGILAATQRLDVAASNIANANSDGPLPSADAAIEAQYPPAYAAEQVNQVAMADGSTRANVSHVQPATVTAYDPTAHYADPNGLVAAPNVNFANDAAQLVAARYDFAMNVQVMRVASQMFKSLLDITT
jgi:flagellar basal-body rod protein FlgC